MPNNMIKPYYSGGSKKVKAAYGKSMDLPKKLWE